MHAPAAYDYCLIRVVPRVERGEFMNVGVIVSCTGRKQLAAAYEIDGERLRALDPMMDLVSLRQNLEAMAEICRGGAAAGALGQLSARQRFDWLTAPRSSVLQVSAVHTGRSSDIDQTIESLMERMVRMGSSIERRAHSA